MDLQKNQTEKMKIPKNMEAKSFFLVIDNTVYPFIDYKLSHRHVHDLYKYIHLMLSPIAQV